MDISDIKLHLADPALRRQEDIDWWISAAEYLVAEVERLRDENVDLLEAYWAQVEKRTKGKAS